jgi:hypothetical protein
MACRTRPPGATGRGRVGQIKHPANASATTKFAKSSGLEPVFGVDDCITQMGSLRERWSVLFAIRDSHQD